MKKYTGAMNLREANKGRRESIFLRERNAFAFISPYWDDPIWYLSEYFFNSSLFFMSNKETIDKEVIKELLGCITRMILWSIDILSEDDNTVIKLNSSF